MLACCCKGQVITPASFYVEHMGNDFPALEQHVPRSPRHNSPIFLRHPRSTEGHTMVRAASFPWDETGRGLPPLWLPSSPGHFWAATHQARPPLEPERTVPWGYFPSLTEDRKDVWPWGSRSVSQQQSYLFFWFFYTNLRVAQPSLGKGRGLCLCNRRQSYCTFPSEHLVCFDPGPQSSF